LSTTIFVQALGRHFLTILVNAVVVAAAPSINAPIIVNAAANRLVMSCSWSKIEGACDPLPLKVLDCALHS
jgi:hypothetical protein